MRVVPLAWSVALGTFALAAPLAAQQSPVVSGAAVTNAEMDAALEARAGTADAQRAAVRRTLDRPEVGAVAQQMGVDIAAAQGAVAALDGDELARAAAASADVDRALAGGETISINATTLIIVLLLIIIVVLI